MTHILDFRNYVNGGRTFLLVMVRRAVWEMEARYIKCVCVHIKFEVSVGNARENDKYLATGVRSMELRIDV